MRALWRRAPAALKLGVGELKRARAFRSSLAALRLPDLLHVNATGNLAAAIAAKLWAPPLAEENIGALRSAP